MSKKMLLKFDSNSEMLEIEFDGKSQFCGNFWDFNLQQDLFELLTVAMDADEIEQVECDYENEE